MKAGYIGVPYRTNKYHYYYVLQGWYSAQYRWEDITEYDTKNHAYADLKIYNKEAPQYQHRVVRRRELL